MCDNDVLDMSMCGAHMLKCLYYDSEYRNVAKHILLNKEIILKFHNSSRLSLYGTKSFLFINEIEIPTTNNENNLINYLIKENILEQTGGGEYEDHNTETYQITYNLYEFMTEYIHFKNILIPVKGDTVLCYSRIKNDELKKHKLIFDWWFDYKEASITSGVFFKYDNSGIKYYPDNSLSFAVTRMVLIEKINKQWE